MSTALRILGIDPGLRATGWGMIAHGPRGLSYIASGTIESNAKAPLADRLLTLQQAIADVIATYHPASCAIEETFVNKNARTSLLLGHARGALMLSVSLAGLPLAEYAARMVKKSVVGVGQADKDQIGAMVRMLLPGSRADSEHAADALAVAICHAHCAAFAKVLA